MKEIKGNLWDYYGTVGYCTVCDSPYTKEGNSPYCAQRHIALESIVEDANFVVCITTNGTVKANGACVMGRGCALEAMKKFPELPQVLGSHLRRNGNVPMRLPAEPLLTFPVKHMWFQQADLELIRRSAQWLAACDPAYTYILPRPGCGNGHLTWEQVKPVIEFLPDNIWVISF